MKNEVIILSDPLIDPNNDVLKKTLDKKYKLFENFVLKITEMGLVLELNYYKDQKNWLCKILNKKKNICWLSIWNIGFKLTFYFNEKTIDDLYELEINNDIKKSANEMKPVGKLRPLIILINNNKILNDSMKILEYKMKLK